MRIQFSWVETEFQLSLLSGNKTCKKTLCIEQKKPACIVKKKWERMQGKKWIKEILTQ